MLDQKNIAILRTLLAIDIATHIHSIPAEVLTQEATPSRNEEIGVFMDAMFMVEPAAYFIGVLYNSNELYGSVSSNVKRKYQQYTAQTRSLLTMNAAIKVLELGPGTAAARRDMLRNQVDLAQSDTLAGLHEDYAEADRLLVGLADEYFQQDKSQLRMFGALIVEDWAAEVVSAAFPVSEGRQTKLRPLRQAIQEEIDRRNQAELEETIHIYEVVINDLETKYNVSSQQLRRLERRRTATSKLT